MSKLSTTIRYGIAWVVVSLLATALLTLGALIVMLGYWFSPELKEAQLRRMLAKELVSKEDDTP